GDNYAYFIDVRLQACNRYEVQNLIDRVTVFDIDGTTILSQDITANGIALLNQVAAATAGTVTPGVVVNSIVLSNATLIHSPDYMGSFTITASDGTGTIPVVDLPPITWEVEAVNSIDPDSFPVSDWASYMTINSAGAIVVTDASGFNTAYGPGIMEVRIRATCGGQTSNWLAFMYFS
ncbi:MAG: hypothetical protein FWE69_06275, partial [Clostridiales bacterium]|nr:hypothetical protein [Clostridiales bacterium]